MAAAASAASRGSFAAGPASRWGGVIALYGGADRARIGRNTGPGLDSGTRGAGRGCRAIGSTATVDAAAAGDGRDGCNSPENLLAT